MPEFTSFAQILGFFYLTNDRQGQPDRERVAYFRSIADHLASSLGPSNVLIVGTTCSALLAALEEQGIAAAGMALPGDQLVDLAPQIREKYRTELWGKGSPGTFDLVICLESLPALDEAGAGHILQAIQPLGEDIIFSATPFPVPGRPELRLRPPGYWAAAWAQQGFVRDFSFEARFISPWAARFRKTVPDLAQLLAAYETRLWEKEQEVQARRALLIEGRDELALKELEIQRNQRKVEEKEAVIQDILNSRSWRTMQKAQRVRLKVIPIGSRQERAVLSVARGARLWRREGTRSFLARLYDLVSWKAKAGLLRFRFAGRMSSQMIGIETVPPRPGPLPHTATVDIVVCVHNALDDVRNCLESVLKYSTAPFCIILIDDGSAGPTQQFLAEFSMEHQARLIRNEDAGGYTRAANQGLRASSGEFTILLNSDTIVTPGWLDRMLACAQSDPGIGIVGPLSNTASWQSIPEIESGGDWATNPLPAGLSAARVGELVDRYSGYLYPRMPFLNGFCLCVRRQVIEQIGYFDEENFGRGYGEENDYCLRARKAGWKLALADQTYIYHAQSKSYSSERRKQLSDRAGETLAQKHGQRIIDQGVEFCRWSPVLEGIRGRGRAMFQREALIEKGRRQYAGKRVLFILPIQVPGGGGNVVISEARAMRSMGVESWILNLKGHQSGFSQVYADLDLPVMYVEVDEIGQAARKFDAVIATFNPSVGWMLPGAKDNPQTIFGYYIQDFEPYFYPVESEGYRRAWNSYTLLPNLRRLTKTDWTRKEVRSQVGVESQVVGPSVNLDLFRPRPRRDAGWPDRPLRIAAMVRPSSPYRAPKETMETLKAASRQFGGAIEIILFGTQPNDPGFVDLPRDFAWALAGVLNQGQIASLLNEVDIFVDFSKYQAMGLTALEAMACGAAVIVPLQGGITEFARDGSNSLMIDTSSEAARWEALRRLIDDHDLRRGLQRRALKDACDYYPEGPAYRILGALFGGQD